MTTNRKSTQTRTTWIAPLTLVILMTAAGGGFSNAAAAGDEGPGTSHHRDSCSINFSTINSERSCTIHTLDYGQGHTWRVQNTAVDTVGVVTCEISWPGGTRSDTGVNGCSVSADISKGVTVTCSVYTAAGYYFDLGGADQRCSYS